MYYIKPHRNSQKRFYNKNHIYFITTVTKYRFPFFKEELFCKLFINNLYICKNLKNYKIYAFTIMPDHVHLLIKPQGKFNVSNIIHAIKRNFSRNINKIINYNITPNEGEVSQPRNKHEINNQPRNKHENNHGKHMRYNKGEVLACASEVGKPRLQCGKYQNYLNVINSHDIMLKNIKHQFIQKYGIKQHIIPEFKWQSSFHDHIIRNEKDFLNHINYINNNCVKHEICDDMHQYKWSSLYDEFKGLIDN